MNMTNRDCNKIIEKSPIQKIYKAEIRTLIITNNKAI